MALVNSRSQLHAGCVGSVCGSRHSRHRNRGPIPWCLDWTGLGLLGLLGLLGFVAIGHFVFRIFRDVISIDFGHFAHGVKPWVPAAPAEVESLWRELDPKQLATNAAGLNLCGLIIS